METDDVTIFIFIHCFSETTDDPNKTLLHDFEENLTYYPPSHIEAQSRRLNTD